MIVFIKTRGNFFKARHSLFNSTTKTEEIDRTRQQRQEMKGHLKTKQDKTHTHEYKQNETSPGRQDRQAIEGAGKTRQNTRQ
jgi:hypothetical protein